MAQIERTGSISFPDAALSVWEDPSPGVGQDWGRQFKRDVFRRIVWQLNRLGWTCVVPQDMIKQYSVDFARNHRYCRKGELQAELSLSGRCIEFKMFQAVNCPTRPDHDGRYELNKEEVMPYLLRLEMERTRRRIRDYLCNVFTDYRFDKREKFRKIGPGVGQVTALEAAAMSRRTSGHYVAELDRARICNPGYDKSSDGEQLENGVKVYAMLRNGRMVTGIAFYSLNGNWQIVTGRYGLECVWHKQIWVNNPGNLRARRDTGQRRKRLEAELSKAVTEMNFERAAVLRDILFPKGAELFVVRHMEQDAFHRPGFCGYTSDLTHAGKFTAAEVVGWGTKPNQVLSLAEAAATA